MALSPSRNRVTLVGGKRFHLLPLLTMFLKKDLFVFFTYFLAQKVVNTPTGLHPFYINDFCLNTCVDVKA